MPLKRSRPLTEEKFQNAVVDLVAESGCAVVGINVVAQRAGADKVLIYRYFGDLNGLWQRVADSRDWLPESASFISEIQNVTSSSDALRRLTHEVISWLKQDRAASALLAWRKATNNPLTAKFAKQWQTLWDDLAEKLSNGLDFEQRRQWTCACELAALLVEAEICNETPDSHCIDLLSANLEMGQLIAEDDIDNEDALPTNLL